MAAATAECSRGSPAGEAVEVEVEAEEVAAARMDSHKGMSSTSRRLLPFPCLVGPPPPS